MNKSTIYKSMKKHQQRERWQYQEVMPNLHLWVERFVFEFKLKISGVTIGVQALRHRDGQFRFGHNDFGLRREILLDQHHVKECLCEEKYYDLAGTVLHELLHAWQEVHGKPGKRNYHNREFQRKAAELGLIVSPQGYQQYEPPGNSPFFALLDKYGVHVPSLSEPDRLLGHRKQAGNSKLKLWECGCQPPVKVRVGIKTFEAQCLICGCNFENASIVEAT